MRALFIGIRLRGFVHVWPPSGLPAYTTAAGWLGYSEEKIVRLSNKFMAEGFTAFKLKVGSDVEDDIRRCR